MTDIRINAPVRGFVGVDELAMKLGVHPHVISVDDDRSYMLIQGVEGDYDLIRLLTKVIDRIGSADLNLAKHDE